MELLIVWVVLICIGLGVLVLTSASRTSGTSSSKGGGEVGENQVRQKGIRRIRSVGVVQVTTETAVAFFLGKIRPKPVSRIYFLPFHRVYAVPRQEQRIEVPPAKVVFAGGAEASIGMEMTFLVSDVVALVGNSIDYMPIIATQATQMRQRVLQGTDINEVRGDTNAASDMLYDKLKEELADIGVRVTRFGITSFDIAAELLDSLVRPAAQRADTEADGIRADAESDLAAKYMKAARAYLPSDASEEEVAMKAMELRRLATYEDMKSGSVLLPPPGN